MSDIEEFKNILSSQNKKILKKYLEILPEQLEFDYHEYIKDYDSDDELFDENKKIIMYGNKIIRKILEIHDDKFDLEKRIELSKNFLEYCKNDHYSMINSLLEDDIDNINFRYQDEEKNTAIMYLIKNKKINVLNSLLKKDNIDLGLNLTDNEGRTPLILAVMRSLNGFIEKLLEKPSDEILLNHKSLTGQNALYTACIYNNKIIINLLLDKEDIDVNCQKEDKTIIHYLIKNKLENEIIKVLDKGYQLFNILLDTDNGKIPLFNAAIITNMKKLANKLFDEYFDKINIEYIDELNTTTLMWACNNNIPDLAIKLIKTGKIDLDKVDNEGSTALIYACQEDENMLKVVLELLKYENINLNQQNSGGNTAFMLVCYEEYFEKAAYEMLNRKDLDINLKNDNDYTALLISTFTKNENLAIAILKTGKALVNILDKSKDTVLYFATKNNLYELSYLLVNNHKCLPEQINDKGDQALIWACSNDMDDIALKILENKNVKPFEKRNNKKGVLDYAFENNLHEVILKLIEFMTPFYIVDNIDKIKENIYSGATSKRKIYLSLISSKLNFMKLSNTFQNELIYYL